MANKAGTSPSYIDPANEIWPNLYLGGKQAAMSPIFISRIQLVINCAADEVSCYPDVIGAHPVYYLISVKDDCTENSNRVLYQHLDIVTALVHKCLEKNQSCYIHCHLGAQRSCAVAAAYLMRYHGMTLDYAISHLRSKRSIAFCGGIHFLKALRQYESDLLLRKKIARKQERHRVHAHVSSTASLKQHEPESPNQHRLKLIDDQEDNYDDDHLPRTYLPVIMV